MKTVRRRAFTLTELLVVIGIIALLIAIALPVIGGVRKRAQATTCLSNTKQYALAMQAYTQDYDGNYPIESTALYIKGHSEAGDVIDWYQLLLPYTKGKSLHCPLRELRDNEIETISTVGYAMNSDLNDDVVGDKDSKYSTGKNEAIILFQSRQVTLFDARVGITARNTPDFKFPEENEDGRLRKLTAGYVRHNGGGNYAFADGHAKWFRYQSFLQNGKFNFDCTDGESRPCFRP